MGKRYVSVNAICPFYRSEEKQKVYCEGVKKGSSIHLAFGDAKYLKIYMDEHCRSDYETCIIAKALLRKYEEEG